MLTVCGCCVSPAPVLTTLLRLVSAPNRKDEDEEEDVDGPCCCTLQCNIVRIAGVLGLGALMGCGHFALEGVEL